MDRILSVGTFQEAQKACNDALKAAGYAVLPCAGPAHAKWLFRKHRHEVVLLGPSLTSRARTGLATCVRQISPQTRIVGLYVGAIEGAHLVNAIVRAESGPVAVVDAVRQLRAEQSGITQTVRTKVLCIAATQNAAILRKRALVDEGYDVVGAASLKEIESACATDVFDLIVVGPVIGPRMKSAIADILHGHQGATPILELGQAKPLIPGADCVLADLSSEWLAAVRLILHRAPQLSSTAAQSHSQTDA